MYLANLQSSVFFCAVCLIAQLTTGFKKIRGEYLSCWHLIKSDFFISLPKPDSNAAAHIDILLEPRNLL